jgi:hypothetical protein
MRLALVLVWLLVACGSKPTPEACKKACLAAGDQAKQACGEVASMAEYQKLTSEQQQAHEARRTCQMEALDTAIECSRACDKK